MSNTYKPIEGESLLVSINTYIETKLNEVGIDLSFQSRARWGLEQEMKFINSCLVNMNINKFILVDIKSCIQRFEVDSDDYNYYNKWLKKYKYLNVDSNNRNTTLIKFTKDLVPIMPGTYTFSGRQFTVVKNKNDLYSTMDLDFKNLFLSNDITTYTITKASRLQLSDVFMRMNSGLPLNHFEKVNCSPSETCITIRNLADKYGGKFVETKMFSETDINRRIIDGYIAHVSYLYAKGYSQPFSKNTHTKWYTKGSESEDIISSFRKNYERYMKLVGDKIKLFQHKFPFFDLFYLINEQENKNKKLVNKKEIVDDFIDVYTKLFISKDYYSFRDKDGKEIKEHGVFPFKHFVKGEGLMTPTRFYYYEKNGFDISKYFIDTDPKRVMSSMEKQGLAVDSNWKDSDGKEIPREKLHDDYDAGHVKAHAKGGKTEPSNMVIEEMSKNRSKGTEETKIAI